MHLETVNDQRWVAALELLESGEAVIGLGDLVLSCDLATDRVGRRLHIEFPCPSDPLQAGAPPSIRLGGVANSELSRARALISSACDADPRFQALVADSDVLYEFVHDYGMGTVLVAAARPSGPLTWKQ